MPNTIEPRKRLCGGEGRCAAVRRGAADVRTSGARCNSDWAARLVSCAMLMMMLMLAWGCEKTSAPDAPPHWSERMQDIPQAHLSVRVAELDRRIAADPDQPDLRIERGMSTAQLAMYEEPLRQIHLLAMALHDFRTAHEQSGGWWPIVYELYDPAEEETLARAEAEKPRHRTERGGDAGALACAAYVLFNSGAVHDAITLLDEAAKSPGQSTWVRTIDAYVRAAVQAGSWELAARELGDVTEHCAGPHCPLAHQLLGLLHLAHGRLEAAADSLGRSFELDPHDLTTLMQYSMALNRLGRTDEAEAVLKKYVAKDRLAISRAFENAESLRGAGRHDEALAIARTILLQYPAGDEIRELIGRIHLGKGEYREALRAFEPVRATHPAHTAAQYGIARAYHGLQRFRDALGIVDVLLEQEHALPDLHRMRALCLAQLDEPAAAEAAFREALRAAPSSTAVLLDYGAFLAGLGRLDEAKEHFLAAARQEPRNATAAEQLGRIELRRGEPRSAAVHFRKSRALAPESAALHPLIAALLECGEIDEALQRAEEILAREPRNADALEWRGFARLASGDLESAAADIAEAVRIQPRADRRLAQVLLLRARDEDPRMWGASLQTLAQRNHDFDWAAVHLFLAADELGCGRAAVRCLARLLAGRGASASAMSAARYLNGDAGAEELLGSAATRSERVRAHYVIAEAHRMAGRTEAAREHYRNALEFGAKHLPLHHLAQLRLRKLESAAP